MINITNTGWQIQIFIHQYEFYTTVKDGLCQQYMLMIMALNWVLFKEKKILGQQLKELLIQMTRTVNCFAKKNKRAIGPEALT